MHTLSRILYYRAMKDGLVIVRSGNRQGQYYNHAVAFFSPAERTRDSEDYCRWRTDTCGHASTHLEIKKTSTFLAHRNFLMKKPASSKKFLNFFSRQNVQFHQGQN